ncbi:MAG: hypothetical protein ACXW05_17270 [Gemmatirosa sp.]
MPSDLPDPRAGQPRGPKDPRDEHPQLADTASFPTTSRSARTPADAPRPMDADEKRSVEITSGPAGALAGAAAGATAGLVSLVAGPLGIGIGAIVGAMAGGIGGWFGGQAASDVRYDASHDAHYRALYEGGVASDRGFDAVRPAYQFGHLAAHNPEWRGREISHDEPELRRAWEGHAHGREGLAWDAVRSHARDAYGHARSEGAGMQRDYSVIGSAGSAVDPEELARAQHGQPSTDYAASGTIAVRDDETGAGEARNAPPGLGERPEIDAGTAHRRNADAEFH